MTTSFIDDADRNKVTVGIQSGEIALVAGQRTQIPVTIANNGLAAGYFEVRVVGLSSSWISLPTPPVLYLQAGERQTIQLTLQPPVGLQSKGERRQGEIHVLQQETGIQVSARTFDYRLLPYKEQGKIGIILQSRRYDVAPGARFQIPLTLINQGEEEYFEIAVLGIPSGWVSASLPVVQLPEGARKPVTLQIKLPPAAQIRAADYTMQIRLTGQRVPGRVAVVSVDLSVAAVQVEGRIGIRMAAVEFSVAPGSSTDIPLQISNQGLEPDRFRLSVSDIPPAWVSTGDAVTYLEPGEEREVTLTIRPPLAPESLAGRYAFAIQVTSEAIPDQAAAVECKLSVSAFTTYAIALEPTQAKLGEISQVDIHNQGNVRQTFTVTLKGDDDNILFEMVPPSELVAEPAAKTPEQEATPANGNGAGNSQVIRIPAGSQATVAFRAKPRKRPLVGNDVRLPFTAVVQPKKAEAQSITGALTSPPLIPTWAIAGIIIACLAFSGFAVLMLGQDRRDEATNATTTAVYQETQVAVATEQIAATQTIAANLTREADAGQLDSDGDGLSDAQELELGTDPNNPDSDADGLLDGQEVLVLRTNPLNPDTDADALGDGEEVQRGTDPLNPDTDTDQSNDGEEISRGTNPLNPDTDNDRLLDGQETPPCPNPLDPDSDDDGITDGNDLDPCDPNNPSLTATAVAGDPPTAVPTEAPPTAVPATEEPAITPLPTEPALPTATSETPPIPTQMPEIPLPLTGFITFISNRDGQQQIFATTDQGNDPAFLIPAGQGSEVALSPDGNRIAFTTNRDGNSEIYVADANGNNAINVTNNLADDRFPVWSPDGDQIAFTTDRDGNQEIYVMEADGSQLENLTNNPTADYAPTWFVSSRTGSELIAFTTDRDGNTEIYTMTPQGDNQTNITNDPAQDDFPAGGSASLFSGSPGIAFMTDRDGNLEIYLMETDGDNPRNLTNDPASDVYPVWSSDADQIAFTTNRDGNNEIYVMQANGRLPTNITNNPADDQYPSWQ